MKNIKYKIYETLTYEEYHTLIDLFRYIQNNKKDITEEEEGILDKIEEVFY